MSIAARDHSTAAAQLRRASATGHLLMQLIRADLDYSSDYRTATENKFRNNFHIRPAPDGNPNFMQIMVRVCTIVVEERGVPESYGYRTSTNTACGAIAISSIASRQGKRLQVLFWKYFTSVVY